MKNKRNRRDICNLCCSPDLSNEPVISLDQSTFLSEKYGINVSLIDILFYIHEFYKIRFFSWSLAIKYAKYVKILWKITWDKFHGGIRWWVIIKRRHHWKRYLKRIIIVQQLSFFFCNDLIKFIDQQKQLFNSDHQSFCVLD